MSKPRIFWTDSTGKKRDIPERATVTLVGEDGKMELRAWIEGNEICTMEIKNEYVDEEKVVH